MIEVGDKVNYHAIKGLKASSGDHVVKMIELEPNNFGCDVAWITGKSGCVALDHLTKD